jgi:hypothetical protein
LVAFGGDEMFRDGIRRFVAPPTAAGVDTTAIEKRDVFHAFDSETSARRDRSIRRVVPCQTGDETSRLAHPTTATTTHGVAESVAGMRPARGLVAGAGRGIAGGDVPLRW